VWGATILILKSSIILKKTSSGQFERIVLRAQIVTVLIQDKKFFVWSRQADKNINNMMNRTCGFSCVNNVQLLSLRVYSLLLPAILTIMAVC